MYFAVTPDKEPRQPNGKTQRRQAILATPQATFVRPLR